ncbi:septal ring lytic transglycosylase RlpA family protein [Plasticicumulans acidivorans]|uniref:Endolytic peptidoglycan transglycosylase RlpA n=1 Tax=Plasticicumulans acidivorans TaxID=886464 RepID=A0A317MQQ2_9GAMM|nr:septal ring lytic transglycosylase RlpA family protein [Plasticicumulans acidivorans]PWV58383.1 rare lipoprotein A [Plasticicumulans acidivorans]
MRKRRLRVHTLTALASAIWLAACSSTPELRGEGEPPSRSGNPESYVVFGKRYYVLGTSAGYRERGIASWYGDAFHGKKTSSGAPFDMHEISAAHKTLPIPAWVKVTNLSNGKTLKIRVNDRGPFVGDRIIDLSYAAAKELGVTGPGTAQVEVEALAPFQVLADSARRPKPSGWEDAVVANRDKQPAPAMPSAVAPAAVAATVPRASSAWRPQLAANTAAAPRSTTAWVPNADEAPAQPLPPIAVDNAADATPLPAPRTPVPVVASSSEPPAAIVPTVLPVSADALVQVPAGVQPRPVADTRPAPSAATGPVGNANGLFVQLGAFGDRRNAEQLRAQVRGSFDAPVSLDDTRRDGLYRVRLGPFITAADAQRASSRATQLGLGRPRLVVD